MDAKYFKHGHADAVSRKNANRHRSEHRADQHNRRIHTNSSIRLGPPENTAGDDAIVTNPRRFTITRAQFPVVPSDTFFPFRFACGLLPPREHVALQIPYPRDLAHRPQSPMGITHITVRGARQHNLRNVNVSIPRNTLTVVTGLSGSGKSSLAFDT